MVLDLLFSAGLVAVLRRLEPQHTHHVSSLALDLSGDRRSQEALSALNINPSNSLTKHTHSRCLF